MKFHFQKINRKLRVVDETGVVVYTAPDFVIVQSRADFQDLVDKFNEVSGYNIRAIIEFESNVKFRADYRRNRHYETFNERSIP